MKRTVILFAIVLSLLLGAFPVTSCAKDLEPCYHCDKTGYYHCPVCNNTGRVTCDGCHGAGRWACPGEDGRGPCDHGYYTCPGCKGTGHPIDPEGKPDYSAKCMYGGEENNCNGTGKLLCWNCHGAGEKICDRCNGEGIRDCIASICPDARAIGYKCPYCKGAGFLLTNFWPGENDGVQNLPKNGDKIWVGGKSTTYGSSQSGSSPSGFSQAGTSQSGAIQPGGSDDAGGTEDDFRRVVDFAGGNWNIGGKTVRVRIGGQAAEGKIELDAREVIRFEGLDRETMCVRLRGDNDFAVTLVLSGEDETSIGRYEPSDAVLPPENLRFVIEEIPRDGGAAEEVPLPADRHSDFDLSVSPAWEGVARSSARVETAKMTDDEQRFYAGLTNEELAGTLRHVCEIVSTAQPGRLGGGMDDVLETLAEQNGYASVEEAHFYPIYFQGHCEIGFPIRVSVELAEGRLSGGQDIFIYHQREDGSIEALGKAEYDTYEDGSVYEISFYTAGFSSFFTATKELTLTPSDEPLDPPAPFPLTVVLIACGAVLLAAGGVTASIVIKKKRG